MKKSLSVLLVIVILIIILGLGYFYRKNIFKTNGGVNQNPVVNQTGTGENASPWIEVMSQGVYKGSAELKTGDQVTQGDEIKTDATGVANIYFPDGSVARINTSTDITLDKAGYDAPSKSIIVNILVSAGKVWSKIMDLATPNSSWQVESSNAVATVRGTAFGMEVVDGNTEIIGSEHNVSVKLKDANNNILSEEVVVGPDKYLKVNSDFVKAVAAKKMTMDKAVLAAPATVEQRVWIQKAKMEDAQLMILKNQYKLDTLGDLQKLKDTLLQQAAQFQQKINELKQILPTNIQIPTLNLITTTPITTPASTTSSTVLLTPILK